ncbi:MAG TPA: ribosome-associated translation inhibitor RaiA [Legionellaceae bacterium]|nr:ribosome-associated translation inhibitor RaiA [Legionellaceae bacterium]
MQIQISGHNMELTQALKDYVHKKAEKLNHHFQHIIAMSVVFTVEKEQQIAEATLTVNQFEAHAHASTTDMYASIDQMINKLDKQIQKYKEKIQNHHRE